MKIVKKWHEKCLDVEVDVVNAATAWDLDFKRMKR